MIRTINKIIIHCTATPQGREVTKDDLKKWHIDERGWSDIGYHYFIDLKGCLYECRPLRRKGAHTKGQNLDSIGIAYAGGMSKDMSEVKDTRNENQKETLEKLLIKLKTKFPNSIIYGHRNFSKKQCPGFDAKKEYQYISDK